MPQHTAAVPVSELTTDQAVRHLIRTAIPIIEEKIMELTAATQRLTTEVTTQLQQTADALAALQDAVTSLQTSEQEKAELQARLDEALASNANAVEAINAQADALASDNPVVEEPVEEPVEEHPVDEPQPPIFFPPPADSAGGFA